MVAAILVALTLVAGVCYELCMVSRTRDRQFPPPATGGTSPVRSDRAPSPDTAPPAEGAETSGDLARPIPSRDHRGLMSGA
ncbi:hypothetical protein Aros01_02780 [Streptosporangium roseum]